MALLLSQKKNSPSDIKEVFDLNQDILFFSRNDIPLNYKKKNLDNWKLVFIVPHRKKWVQKYLVWEQTPLELIEDNHFLRLVEHGVKIKAVEVNGAKISVDTQKDLNEVRALMEIDKLKNNYLKLNIK